MPKRPLDQIMSELHGAVKQARACSLMIGDLLVEIELSYGQAQKRLALTEVGLSESEARQKYWVAKNIPPTSPIRKMDLPYGHLRAIAGAPASERLILAKQAVKDQWTATRIRAEVDNLKGRPRQLQTAEDRSCCTYCETPWSKSSTKLRLCEDLQVVAIFCDEECLWGWQLSRRTPQRKAA